MTLYLPIALRKRVPVAVGFPGDVRRDCPLRRHCPFALLPAKSAWNVSRSRSSWNIARPCSPRQPAHPPRSPHRPEHFEQLAVPARGEIRDAPRAVLGVDPRDIDGAGAAHGAAHAHPALKRDQERDVRDDQVGAADDDLRHVLGERDAPAGDERDRVPHALRHEVCVYPAEALLDELAFPVAPLRP